MEQLLKGTAVGVILTTIVTLLCYALFTTRILNLVLDSAPNHPHVTQQIGEVSKVSHLRHLPSPTQSCHVPECTRYQLEAHGSSGSAEIVAEIWLKDHHVSSIQLMQPSTTDEDPQPET